jgi:hypothetical protein
VGGSAEDLYRQAHNIPVASAEDKTAREKALKHLLGQKPQEDTNKDGSPVGGVGNGHRKYKLDKHQTGINSMVSNTVHGFVHPWQQQAQTEDKPTSSPSTISSRVDAGFGTTGKIGKAKYSTTPAAGTTAPSTFNYLPLPSFSRGVDAPVINNGGILGGKVRKRKSGYIHSNDASLAACRRMRS